MRTMKQLLASLFLATLIAVPIYAHYSFTDAPKCDTYAQCTGDCANCGNTNCSKNPGHKSSKSGAEKSGSEKPGSDKAGADKVKDQTPDKK